MAAKGILVFCASALLLQSVYSACLGGMGAPYGIAGTGCGYNGFAGPGLGYDGFAGPFGFEGFGLGAGCGGVASTGGGLPVTCASPIPPVGVSVLSENICEGVLAAGGNLPFLGTVAIQGVLPTAGAGAVSYGCGNGACTIGAEEGAIATGIAPYGAFGGYGAYGPGLAGAYGPGLAGAYGPGLAGAYEGFGGFGCGVGAAGYGAGYAGGCGCGGFY